MKRRTRNKRTAIRKLVSKITDEYKKQGEYAMWFGSSVGVYIEDPRPWRGHFVGPLGITSNP